MEHVSISDGHGQRIATVDDYGGLHVALASGDQIHVNRNKSIRVRDELSDAGYAGEAWDIAHYDAGASQNENVEVLIRMSGDAGRVVISASAGDDAVMHLHEAVGFSSCGTALDMFNVNRSYSNSGDFRAYHTPTITNSGDRVESVFLPDGREAVIDKHLKASEEYLLQVTQLGSSSEPVNVRMRVHECGA